MTKSNFTSVDTDTLYLAGTALTSTAGEYNLFDQEYQLIEANGNITVKNGICRMAKTVAGALAIDLPDPTVTTDDFKRLTIINFQAQQNVVTSASSFGGAGGGEDVATFTNTIGNTLSLMAYQGVWYITGQLGVTVA